MGKERHPANHMHEPGACRLQPLLIALTVIALRFVGRHQRYREQANQQAQQTTQRRYLGVVHNDFPWTVAEDDCSTSIE